MKLNNKGLSDSVVPSDVYDLYCVVLIKFFYKFDCVEGMSYSVEGILRVNKV